jgi:hypothetical protein
MMMTMMQKEKETKEKNGIESDNDADIEFDNGGMEEDFEGNSNEFSEFNTGGEEEDDDDNDGTGA